MHDRFWAIFPVAYLSQRLIERRDHASAVTAAYEETTGALAWLQHYGVDIKDPTPVAIANALAGPPNGAHYPPTSAPVAAPPVAPAAPVPAPVAGPRVPQAGDAPEGLIEYLQRTAPLMDQWVAAGDHASVSSYRQDLARFAALKK